MAEKKNESFTVTDRRLFTADGELRHDAQEQERQEQKPGPSSVPTAENSAEKTAEPQGPSAIEQEEQADAYQKSSAEMDRQAELGGISAKDMEITFERFLASLYMTGMLQLGLMHEPDAPPQLD